MVFSVLSFIKMTLLQLFNEMKKVGDKFTTWDIRITKDGKDIGVEFKAIPDEDGKYHIEMNTKQEEIEPIVRGCIYGHKNKPDELCVFCSASCSLRDNWREEMNENE